VGCWTEADRDRVVYGTKADLECAARCAKDGIPAALATYRDGKFTVYLHVRSLTGTTWESLGFPTGPPAR
jgi:hypothetical protein